MSSGSITESLAPFPVPPASSSVGLRTVQYQIGAAVDAYFELAADGRMGRSDTFTLETENPTHWSIYAFAMADPNGTGLFRLADPALPPGIYNVFYRARQGGSAAVDDLDIGGETVQLPTGAAIPAPADPNDIDPVGWPTVAGVLSKCASVLNVDGINDPVTSDIQAILTSVIAEIQGLPRGPRPGTGRRFTPLFETRLFDGNGMPELIVDDVVPGTSLLVQIFTSTITGTILKQAGDGYGWNTLVRPQALGTFPGWAYMPAGLWPIGHQNISVAATWGFAATVPVDVSEAVRCEVAHRAIRQGAIALTGVGESVTIGGFSITTSAGISVWRESSPVQLLHEVYEGCIERLKIRGERKRRELLGAGLRGRMS